MYSVHSVRIFFSVSWEHMMVRALNETAAAKDANAISIKRIKESATGGLETAGDC